MQNYICLLRGINVSGQKKIKMVELKSAFETLGFTDVTTYIQSGNVIFKSAEVSTEKLEQEIQNMLQDHFGFDIETIVLTHSELSEAVKNNPYVQDQERDEKKLYIAYLKDLPEQAQLDHLATYDYFPEVYHIIDKVLYFYAANGAGRAKMNTNFFEAKLKVKATMRNWRTSNKLLELSK
mgnify:CR=1 FL=1